MELNQNNLIPKIGVYKRVSTDRQDMAMQDHAINDWLRSKGWLLNVVAEYRDVYTGNSSVDDRHGFAQLCAAVERGEIDCVVVYRLDRLSRKAAEALELLLSWMKRNVEFFAVDQKILHLGKDMPFRLTILSMFAELAAIERETIVARVKTGLAAAKARGVKLGKQGNFSESQIAAAVSLMKQESLSLRETAERTGVPKSTIHKFLKAQQ